MSNKKVKNIQTIVDEYTAKQRNVNNYDQVQQYVKRVQDTMGASTKHPLTTIFSVEALHFAEKYDEALTTAKQGIEQIKDDAVSLHLLAKTQLKLGQIEDAERNVTSSKDNFAQQAQQAATDNTAHLFTSAYKGLNYQNNSLQAQVLYAKGKRDEAAKILEQLYTELVTEQKQAITIDATSFASVQEGFVLLAGLKKDEGRYDDCLKILLHTFEKKVPLNRESALRTLSEISTLLVHQYTYNNLDKSKANGRDIAEDASQVLLLMEHLSSNTSKYEQIQRAIYDDMTILIASFRQYKPLLKVLERGVSRFYESCHFWYQFALALVVEKKFTRAYKVLTECESLDPHNLAVQVLKLKVSLNIYAKEKCKENLETAQRLVESCTKSNALLLPRAYHYLGLAYGNTATELSSVSERQVHQTKAIEALSHARELDKNDPLICYHLALQFASIREVKKAFRFVKKSLSIDSSNVDAWILLVLLFTCEKDFKNAAKAAKLAKTEHPNSVKLSLICRRLDELENEKKSDRGYFKLLEEVRRRYFDQPSSAADNAAAEGSAANADHNSAVSGNSAPQAQPAAHIPSITITNAAATATAAAVAATGAAAEAQASLDILISGKRSKYHKQRILNKVVMLYLYVADALRRLSKFNEAMQLLKAVSDVQKKQNQPASADLFFVTGFINEETKRTEAALTEYEGALIRDANHKQSLMRIGLIQQRQMKQNMLARSYLQSAVRADSNFHEAWYHLGVVMREMGELEEASDCFMTALKLEKTAPLVPFELLLRRKV